MKKISLKTWIHKIQLVSLRFPFTLIFIFGLAYYFLLTINHHDAQIQQRIWAFLGLGISISIAVTLFAEEFKNYYVRIGLNILSIILISIYVYLLPEKLLPYNYYQLIIIGLVFILAAFVVSFLKENNDIPFWEFSKTVIIQLIISSIFAQVLMSGLSLAILSLKELFDVNIKSEVYANLAVVCYVIFAPMYFLANVPDETEKQKTNYTFNKFIKILGLYIILPILAIYSLILYVYLAQIIIKWELPNGWVSTLTSILALGGFACMLILYPLRLEKDNKIVDLLSRYFPLLLLPLLVLMSVGIFRRLDDYGLTINRSYVLILNVWLYAISFYLFVSKAKHLKWIVISFAIIAFLSSVGPWSVFSVTKKSLVSNLEISLENAKLSKNRIVKIPIKNDIIVDTIFQKDIIEKIRYLSENYGNESFQKFFSISIKEKSPSEIFKLLNLNEQVYTNKIDEFISAYWGFKTMKMDVDNYKTFVKVIISDNNDSVYLDNNLSIKYDSINQTLLVKNNDKNLSISLKDKIQSIRNKTSSNNNNQFSEDELTINSDTYKLLIISLNGKYEKNSQLKITNLEAYLFY